MQYFLLLPDHHSSLHFTDIVLYFNLSSATHMYIVPLISYISKITVGNVFVSILISASIICEPDFRERGVCILILPSFPIGVLT